MNATQQDGYCQEIVHGRRSVGILAKGTESFTDTVGWCQNRAVEDSSFCRFHNDKAAETQRKLVTKRAYEARQRELRAQRSGR